MAEDLDTDTGIAANPTPSFSVEDVFGRIFSTLGTLGGNYLTQAGNQTLATQAGAAQARINGYSAVNPSLGAVDPYAAQQVANQTLAERWLPWGSPVVGVPGTGATATASPPAITKYLLWGGAILLGLFVLMKVAKK